MAKPLLIGKTFLLPLIKFLFIDETFSFHG
jgi:hypothetical protein